MRWDGLFLAKSGLRLQLMARVTEQRPVSSFLNAKSYRPLAKHRFCCVGDCSRVYHGLPFRG